MPTKYQHLFFDLDHTLWDFDRNAEATWRKLYAEYNLEARGITDFDLFFSIYNKYNDALWAKFRNREIKREDLRWKRIWHTLLDLKLPDDVLAHELSDAFLELLPTQKLLMPHAEEVLAYCSTHYHLHLITNGFETTQWQKLQYSGIGHFFDKVITSEKSNSIKPHPEIFEFALQETGATRNNALMIGDAIDIDILGARNAGWHQVYYNPAKLKHDQLVTYEISDLNELKEIL